MKLIIKKKMYTLKFHKNLKVKMAVFTKLHRNEIEDFVNLYSIGTLDDYFEIIDGIENTNYKIICNGIPYILTIFEKRVNEKDLPFFVNLKLYLNENNFKCPRPIKNNDNEIINVIKNKKAIIISYIEGKKVIFPTINECFEVGKMLSKLHNLTKNFEDKRKNSLDIKDWQELLKKCENNENDKFNILINDLKNEINFLEKYWPVDLPSGIIHADLFRDNIFFNEEKITGVIDFYFSCHYFLLYDIAIVVNDWCFNKNGDLFNHEYFDSIIKGYNIYRDLTKKETKVFNVLLRAAAVRILITRLFDYIFHPEDAIVVKKDPYQYYNILKWHQNNDMEKL